MLRSEDKKDSIAIVYNTTVRGQSEERRRIYRCLSIEKIINTRFSAAHNDENENEETK